MKIDHNLSSWKQTKNRMVLRNDPRRPYEKASPEQLEKGRARRKLEDLKDRKDLESYVRDIWDE